MSTEGALVTRSGGVVLAAVLATVALLIVVITYVVVERPAAPQPAAQQGGTGGPVVTAFHVISEIDCTGPTASVPAAWATRGVSTVAFEVDGRPLPAAAGYATTGTGDLTVPCDGREHEVTLVATGEGTTVRRSQHVNTRSTAPPPGGPTVTAFQVLGDVSCPGGEQFPVAAAWATQNATTVSFSVDGQPLPAAAGYPTTGTGRIPVPCDGRAHKVTLTAANAANATSALSRSVNTTPYAPVPPVTTTTTTTRVTTTTTTATTTTTVPPPTTPTTPTTGPAPTG